MNYLSVSPPPFDNIKDKLFWQSMQRTIMRINQEMDDCHFTTEQRIKYRNEIIDSIMNGQIK